MACLYFEDRGETELKHLAIVPSCAMCRKLRRLVRRILFGDSDLPRQFTVGMHDPQSEITVWLHGLSEPRDVTNQHVMACVKPLTIGVVLNPDWGFSPASENRLSLRFCERFGDQRLMGEIFLSGPSTEGPIDHLRMFQVRGSANYCMSIFRLLAHQAWLAYTQWRFNNNPEIKPTRREAHALIVFFICPRPVVLVSVLHGQAGNVFPMNLMGPVGPGRFAFALNSTRHAAPIIGHAGRLAISSVPLGEAALAKQLGRNHLKDSIDVTTLPFASRRSPEFGFPVPEFAVRVREMKVEYHHRLGSHTFFVARLVSDERFSESEEFFYVHGIYQAWRIRHGLSSAS